MNGINASVTVQPAGNGAQQAASDISSQFTANALQLVVSLALLIISIRVHRYFRDRDTLRKDVDAHTRRLDRVEDNLAILAHAQGVELLPHRKSLDS
jgi:hypothetical protein